MSGADRPVPPRRTAPGTPSRATPASSLAPRARRRASRRGTSSARQVVERLDRDEPRLGVRSGLPIEPDLARPTGIEDEDRDGQSLVLVGGVRPGVVELVEDVGVDPARTPLAVDRLGGAGNLD